MINGFEEIGWKKANIYLHVYDEVRNIRIANAGFSPLFFGGGGIDIPVFCIIDTKKLPVYKLMKIVQL